MTGVNMSVHKELKKVRKFEVLLLSFNLRRFLKFEENLYSNIDWVALNEDGLARAALKAENKASPRMIPKLTFVESRLKDQIKLKDIF